MAILIKHQTGNPLWKRDTSLSFRAKGIMLCIMAMPNEANISQQELYYYATDGDQAIRSAVEELRLHNYLRKNRVRTDKGVYVISVWEAFDEPSAERLDFNLKLTINDSTLKI